MSGLGEREESRIYDSDTLTALKFNDTGEYIAVGDCGGRVIIFKRAKLMTWKGGIPLDRGFDYRYSTEV